MRWYSDSCRGGWQELSFFLPKAMLEISAAFVSICSLMFTLSATCKNKGRRHSIHLQWTIWGGFWSMLAFLGTYIHYHCCAMRLCLHHNRYCTLYFISAHGICLSILAVIPLWNFPFSSSWIGWERDWWAESDILPWSRLVNNWRNKIWGYYCSCQECWWGLFSMIFIYIIMLLDSAYAPASISVW